MDKIYLHLRTQDQEETRKHNIADHAMDNMKHREYHRLTRLAVLSHYGGKCACCGESTYEFLCIDHIDGGGNKHRRDITHGGGMNTYRWIIKNNYPKGFQVLCHNCNLAKGFYGYCPHKRK